MSSLLRAQCCTCRNILIKTSLCHMWHEQTQKWWSCKCPWTRSPPAALPAQPRRAALLGWEMRSIQKWMQNVATGWCLKYLPVLIIVYFRSSIRRDLILDFTMFIWQVHRSDVNVIVFGILDPCVMSSGLEGVKQREEQNPLIHYGSAAKCSLECALKKKDRLCLYPKWNPESSLW